MQQPHRRRQLWTQALGLPEAPAPPRVPSAPPAPPASAPPSPRPSTAPARTGPSPLPLLALSHPSLDHAYHRQIMLDIGRAFHFTRCRTWSDTHRERRVQQLGRVLHRAFAGFAVKETIHYFQGAHDVASVLLLSLGPVAAVPALQTLLRVHLRGYVHSDMQVTVCVLQYLFPLVRHRNAALFQFLRDSKVQPFFALSWIITWFAHSIKHLPTLAGMFDDFLTSHPLLPLYYAAAAVLYRADELLALPCEASAVHECMQQLPQPLPRAQLHGVALKLLGAVPPQQLLESEAVDEQSRELLRSQWPELWTGADAASGAWELLPTGRRRHQPGVAGGFRGSGCVRAAGRAVWWASLGTAALAVLAALLWFWVAVVVLRWL